MNKEGSLTINSENIFPIIKKWLYSDHDIFFREAVSNGCDAITKLKKLGMIGEYEIPEDTKFEIHVIVDAEAKTISFSDNGIGMDAEEVDRYINQIAFSGAKDFLETYKDKTNDDQIIGHFGLGFYSVFMVADRVTIDTLSWKPGAVPVFWESDGGTSFAMSDGTRTEVGTTITLYLGEDSYEFSNEYRAREVLEKYCSFMPVPIFLDVIKEKSDEAEAETVGDAETVEAEENAETLKAAESEEPSEDAASSADEDGKEEKEDSGKAAPKEPKPINTVDPLWNKHPNECKDEDYKDFYRRVFHDYREPLFWIHLNMDYPFNLKGILYFPKINTEYDSIEGTIKLYNNQVFVADNIKEDIPEFLMLLKGVIDCPDLPLNVSRSALQNDGFVKKISDYITKKVADRLTGMCKTDRENYEKYWDDINPFIKFGCLKDEKFAEKMRDYIIFRDLSGKYLTLPDILKENEEKQQKNKVFYVTDEKEQSQYIEMFKKQELNAVILKHTIDSPFITRLEQTNPDVRFLRIDADLTDSFREEVKEEEKENLQKDSDALKECFRKALSNDKLEVRAEKLKDASLAAVITLPEESRRMQEMMKMYGMADMDLGPQPENLVLNLSHPLVQYVLAHKDEDVSLFCEQIYDLAALAHGSLSPERMTAFITRTNDVMLRLAE